MFEQKLICSYIPYMVKNYSQQRIILFKKKQYHERKS